jgi:hypothetical protein
LPGPAQLSLWVSGKTQKGRGTEGRPGQIWPKLPGEAASENAGFNALNSFAMPDIASDSDLGTDCVWASLSLAGTSPARRHDRIGPDAYSLSGLSNHLGHGPTVPDSLATITMPVMMMIRAPGRAS